MGIIKTLFGGPPAPLKPTGPAPFAQPDERDREALFWWLKRNTSYTAIEHDAKLWTEFAQEWEKWLRGQDSPYDHLVETFRYILDDKINYERGLARLLKGDRSVFDRNSSEGWLGKINTSLVSRRMEWDAPPDVIAKLWNCPERMVLSYFKAHEALIACSHRGVYRAMVPGRGSSWPDQEARRMLGTLAFDTSLPEPYWNFGFVPGKRAPQDGIYEMVDAGGHIVGGLQFFIKGEASRHSDFVEFGPDADNEDASNFVWRLLWEDTRYKDGTIPEEEKCYPLPGEPLPEVAQLDLARLRCEAGQPCPREGYWFTPAQVRSRRLFNAGEVMPEAGGDYGTTIWQWDPDP